MHLTEQLELWAWYDEEPEPEGDPETVESPIPRKCFCIRSYQTGNLLAICPFHMKRWGLKREEVVW